MKHVNIIGSNIFLINLTFDIPERKKSCDHHSNIYEKYHDGHMKHVNIIGSKYFSYESNI